MKKYVYLLMVICFSISFFYSFNNNKNIEPVFNENNLGTYVITFNNGISLNEYKNIFKNLDINNYYIKNFSFEDRFHDKMNNEINNISLKGGNYLESLNEYVDKYIKILDKYNKELEIDRIYSGNMRISKIYINCLSDIYNEILLFNNNV